MSGDVLRRDDARRKVASVISDDEPLYDSVASDEDYSSIGDSQSLRGGDKLFGGKTLDPVRPHVPKLHSTRFPKCIMTFKPMPS